LDPDTIAYESDHRPTQAIDFDFDAVDAALNPQSEEPETDSVDQESTLFRSREIACQLLQILTEGNVSPKLIGKRALALQYAFNASTHRNQRELAERMGVTPARASQILTDLDAEAARILRGN
jgi:hypothetical protein